jgi:hypothetical protein
MVAEKATPEKAPVVVDDRLPTLEIGSGSDQILLLVYGESGVGKTMLGGSAALDLRTAPVLFVDVEGGTRSISHMIDVATGKGITRYPVTDYTRDVNALMSYLRSATADGNLPYRTLVIDSCTELATRAMASVLESGKQRSSSGSPEYADWNTWTNKMRTLFGALRDLSMDYGLNVIVTALEEDDNGTHRPMFPGKKLTPVLPGFFDMVGRLYSKSMVPADGSPSYSEYRLMLRGDSRYVIKDRSAPAGLLPNELDNPTASRLLERVAEGRKLASTSAQKKVDGK